MSHIKTFFEDEKEIKEAKKFEKKYCSSCDKKTKFKIKNPEDVKAFMKWLDLTYHGQIFKSLYVIETSMLNISKEMEKIRKIMKKEEKTINL